MALVDSLVDGRVTTGRGQAPAHAPLPPDRVERRPGDVVLRYLGVGLFSTRSVISGRSYAFHGTGAELPVGVRDVETLLRTRQFVRL